ncbi:RNA-dependent ATPase rok1 [Toensbergia leucococca]|nr:RNA-dependent ATPase rok1 [Toensbergia leucococca]
MDIFRLLTRSTNLQKSSRNLSEQNVPSAGNSKHIEDLLHEQKEPGEKRIPGSHKRKRDNSKERKRLDSSEQLRVSKEHGEETNGIDKPPKNDTFSPGIAQGGEAKSKAVVLVNEEECRRILKLHKLKITLFKDEPETQNKQMKPRQSSVSSEIPGFIRKKDAHTQLSPQPLTSFKQLRTKYGISKRLAENLNAQGYTVPTDVQLGSLPLLLGTDEDRGIRRRSKSGRKQRKSEVDIMTIAPTGSGKTLAFLIPILHGLLEYRRANKPMDLTQETEHNIQAIIIAPTHELVDQIVNETRKLTIGTGIKVSGMRKGMKLQRETNKHEEDDLHESNNTLSSEHEDNNSSTKSRSVVKADILVSTPLMLLHALSSGSTPTSNFLPTVRYLVLDEADVLLDPLFRTQTLGIWKVCSSPSLQTSLWSATIGSSIESLAQTFILDRRRNLESLPNPMAPSHYVIRLVVGLKDSAIPVISHRLVYTASEQGKLMAIRQLLRPSTMSTNSDPSLRPPFLVFAQTIPRAIALHSELLYDIPPEAGGSSRIAVLHSDLSDNARSSIMAEFRKGEIWVLITTDLLSRGIDFRGINGVVNYDIPNTGAIYIHRVGRTGRQGREGGVAVTFYTKEDIPYVKNVANVIAASEKVNGNVRRDGGDGEDGIQKWLLDALPSVSKKSKKELKMKGVEGRRAGADGDIKGRETKKMRISTKSGYDRRVEHRRKGAVMGSQRRNAERENDSEDEEWGGIDD